jgi:hypothetical protein
VAEYNEAVLAAVREVAQEGATLQGLEQEARSTRPRSTPAASWPPAPRRA